MIVVNMTKYDRTKSAVISKFRRLALPPTANTQATARQPEADAAASKFDASKDGVEPVPQNAAGDDGAPSSNEVYGPDADDSAERASDFSANGDEVDIRMAEIDEILRHAAMRRFDKCILAAEWVHHAEAKLSVLGQPVHKPGGGRPEGGLTWAARQLCVPGDTPAARRKYLGRAIKIAEIWPEAKSAVRAAGLDNIQSALLAIADEHSQEAQLAKIREIAMRKAMPHRKSTARNPREGNSAEHVIAQEDHGSVVQHALNLPEVAELNEVCTADDETQFGILRETWARDNVVKRAEWQKASPAAQRHFAREFLLPS